MRRICKACGIEKAYIKSGARKNLKSYGMTAFIYVDENGKRWNSRKCYDCNRKWLKKYENKRNKIFWKRSKSESVIEDVECLPDV